MDHIILVRLGNGKIIALLEDPDSDAIATFPNLDEAVRVALDHPLCKAYTFQVVECDEL